MSPATCAVTRPSCAGRAAGPAGLRLLRLEVVHPQATLLRKALSGRLEDARVVIAQGPGKALRASFSTPAGIRRL